MCRPLDPLPLSPIRCLYILSLKVDQTPPSTSHLESDGKGKSLGKGQSRQRRNPPSAADQKVQSTPRGGATSGGEPFAVEASAGGSLGLQDLQGTWWGRVQVREDHTWYPTLRDHGMDSDALRYAVIIK